jgi:hypothetical protein
LHWSKDWKKTHGHDVNTLKKTVLQEEGTEMQWVWDLGGLGCLYGIRRSRVMERANEYSTQMELERRRHFITQSNIKRSALWLRETGSP